MKALGMKEINAIMEITDRLGINREWIEIPLGTESPGVIRKLPDGKYEVVVDADIPFEDWLKTMESELKGLM